MTRPKIKQQLAPDQWGLTHLAATARWEEPKVCPGRQLRCAPPASPGSQTSQSLAVPGRASVVKARRLLR